MKYTPKYIDTMSIMPLNKENLTSFNDILIENDIEFGWTRYYALYGYHMWKSKIQDSAIYYAEKAVENYDKVKKIYPSEEAHLINAFYTLGQVFRDRKNYQKSTVYLIKCLELDANYPVKNRGFIIAGIASNHLSQGNDSLALIFFKRALKDSIFSSYPRPLITTLTRVGLLYGPDYLNIADSAKYYNYKAIKSSIGMDYKTSLSHIYGNMGDLFKSEHKRDSAINYYVKQHEILKKYKPLTKEAKVKTPLFDRVNYSYVKTYSGDPQGAIKDLQMVLDTLKKFPSYNKNDKDLFSALYENMALAYEYQKDFKKANKILRDKEEYINQFHKTQLKQELEKLQMQYETHEKESEIARLAVINENQSILQKRQQAVFYGLTGLLLAILGTVWFYYYQRGLNNKYKRVVLQQQLLRTQMNPHFTFNALNSIIVLNKERPEDVEKYVLNFSKLVRLILENSRDEFVSMEKEVQALESYLMLQSNFSKKFTYQIIIKGEVEPQYCEIPPMMVQPFVENAIVHGIASKRTNGNIDIIFKQKSNTVLQCEITDNGVGYNKEMGTNILTIDGHTSLSTKITNERLAIYNKKFNRTGSVDIQELQNEKKESLGTKVRILLPCNII